MPVRALTPHATSLSHVLTENASGFHTLDRVNSRSRRLGRTARCGVLEQCILTGVKTARAEAAEARRTHRQGTLVGRCPGVDSSSLGAERRSPRPAPRAARGLRRPGRASAERTSNTPGECPLPLPR